MSDKISKQSLTAVERQALDRFVRQLRARYTGRLKQIIWYGHKNRGPSGSDLDVLVVIQDLPDRFAEMARIHEMTGPIKVEEDILITALPVDAAYLESQRETTFFSTILSQGLAL